MHTYTQEITNEGSVPKSRSFNPVYSSGFGRIQTAKNMTLHFAYLSEVGQIIFGLTRLTDCFCSQKLLHTPNSQQFL